MKIKGHIIFVTIICFLFLSPTLKAESVGCIKFKLKLTLENDSVIIGDFFYHGLYAFQDVHPDSFSFEYYRKIRKDFNDTIKIYNNVISLKYPKLYPCKYKACQKEDVLKVALNSIKSHEVISKTICYPELKTLFHVGCGYSPVVITELIKEEIELLNEKEPILSFNFHPDKYCGCEMFCMPIIVSYNKEMTKGEIIEILKKEWCYDFSYPLDDESLCFSRHNALKKRFAKLNIIIFKTYYYN
ncbi:MAG: hypothetical protein K9J13_02800 [Saprospiraceae bacterium]|nr:hypothetical protein [Saprospiraceae bacterium]